MISIGKIRILDDLGRFLIPSELRKIMDIDVQDPIEVYVEDNNIIIKKYIPSCVFCGEKSNNIEYMGRSICKKCLSEMRKE